MTLPKCKIETYTGATLDYTLTNDDIESVHMKDVLNGIGTFNFTVPTLKGTPSSTYNYGDIAVSDKAKFYFWYADTETCPATPDFVGRITKISVPLADGYHRIFEGKLHTEILERRIQPAQCWNNVHVDTIAEEIASELTLGGSVGSGTMDNDDSHVTVYSSNDTYLDLLKKISDYWVSAGSQVRKDFYIDIGDAGHPLGHLYWKTRPVRTANVETLSVGTNILNYVVLRDGEPVKNNITVYGNQGKIGVPGHEGRCQPSDKDGWTETTADWTEELGTLTAESGSPKVGAATLCIQSEELTPGGDEYTKFRRPVNIETYGDAAYQTLNFYTFPVNGLMDSSKLRLYAPDASNYYEADVDFGAFSAWKWQQFLLGQNQEYNVDTNPTGIWTGTGSTRNWTTIVEICFLTNGPPAGHTNYYDGLYFGHGRFRNTATNPASITAYEQRDKQMVDDTLLSDAECQTRAETLLYQLKDSPIRIDVEIVGNTNVKIGDQLSMTIPAEAITASPYDVLTVTHDYSVREFKTSASLLNSSLVAAEINKRLLPCGAVMESIERNFENQKMISKGLKMVK